MADDGSDPGEIRGRARFAWVAMKLARAFFAVGLAAVLAACAGGPGPPIAKRPDLPLQTARHAHQSPIVNLDGRLHVGADVAPPAGALPVLARHGDTSVSYGSVRDGVGAAELLAYLREDAASYANPDDDEGADAQPFPDGLVFRFAATPPTVRVAEGTPEALTDETVRVVQSINAALSPSWQLGFAAGPFTADAPGPPDGEILVTFAPQAQWPFEAAPPTPEDIGIAEPRYSIVPTGNPAAPYGVELVAGRVFVDPTRTEGLERLGVIAHELIHLLGRSHVDAMRFPETLMVDGGSEELSAHVLHPLDREALLAVYGRLVATTAPNLLEDALGPWSDTSMHVRGALRIAGDVEIAFGAALRNGRSQPWAVGPTPGSNLEDNPALSGTVGWSGRLLGLTTSAETVAGAADLTVNLETSTGTADFSALEHWSADAAPGPAGSGTTWREGRLSYGIEVRGNTFVQTGGDAGTVTGVFFGSAHDGMGGVLAREDLSAGFGGQR